MADRVLAELLSFTQKMNALVIEEDWGALQQMQVQQDSMLKAMFARPDLKLSELDTADLQALKALNDQILLSVETRRAAVANEIRSLKRGKVNARAYTSI